MYHIEALLDKGVQSSIYTLQNYPHRVLKVVSSSSVEIQVYRILDGLKTSETQYFCTLWPSDVPHHLVLSKCQRVDWKEVTNVVEGLSDMVQALDILQRLEIVHHDVHPGNIMWNPRKKKYVLLDFGLATIRSKEIVDRCYLNTREDLYSLLYHLTTLHYPKCMHKGTNYRRDRRCWSEHFQRNPEGWPRFKRRFRQWFRGFHRSTLKKFLSTILHVDQPMEAANREEAILLKIMLSRFHLLFCWYHRVPPSFRDAILRFWA